MDSLLGPEGSMRRICAVNTFVILICLLAAIGLFTIVAQAFYLFTH